MHGRICWYRHHKRGMFWPFHAFISRLGVTPKNSTKIGQPYNYHRTRERFVSSIIAKLRIFQNHRRQAKINTYCFSFSIIRSKRITMILNFLNLSMFAHKTADIKLACLQSAVSWAKVDRFKKFKIMVIRLELTREKNEKQYWFLLVFNDFEKVAN